MTKPEFTYVSRVSDQRAIVTCKCGWTEGYAPVSPFDPDEAIASAWGAHPRCPDLASPRRITEQTTLGELAVQRAMLGISSLTLMRDLHGQLTAVVQAFQAGGTSGLHIGQGATEAAAIDAAFASLRQAMLPASLRAPVSRQPASLVNEPRDRFSYPGTLCESGPDSGPDMGEFTCIHCGRSSTDHGAPEYIANNLSVPDAVRHLICRVISS